MDKTDNNKRRRRGRGKGRRTGKEERGDSGRSGALLVPVAPG